MSEKKESENKEDKSLSAYQEREIERIREERHKIEAEKEQIRLNNEKLQNDMRKLERDQYLHEIKEMRKEIRTPIDFFREIKEQQNMFQETGIMGTSKTDRDIQLEKLKQDDRHWQLEFEEAKNERKENVYRDITEAVLGKDGEGGIANKVIDNLPKIKEVFTRRGETPSQPSLYIDESSGDILDAHGNIIKHGLNTVSQQSPAQPPSSSPSVQPQTDTVAYSKEDVAKIAEWQRTKNKNSGEK